MMMPNCVTPSFDKDSKINDKDMDFLLNQLNNANIYALDNLHAKCYLGMIKKQLQVFHFGNDSIIPFP